MRDEIYAFDPAAGTGTLVHTAPDAVLDMVFDFNDDLYVESTDDQLTLIELDGTQTAFATLSGDGKLAITPDGYLVRLIANPVANASFEDWYLD